MKHILLFLALLCLLVPSPVRATEPLPKDTFLLPGFNVSLVNSLGLDHFSFNDPGLFDPAGFGAGNVNAEYIARIPWSGWGMGVFPLNRQLANFHNKWVILNEPAQWGFTPQQAAAAANQVVSELVASDPNADNYVILDFWSQAEDMAWRDTFWSLLTPATVAQVDAIGVHYYPATTDPQETRGYLRWQVRPWMNARSIPDAWLRETGFDAAYHTQDEGAAYVPQLWATLSEFTWLKGVGWFMFSGSGYVDLANDPQTKLTKTGKALRDNVP